MDDDTYKNDLERAKQLGLTLDQFQSLAGLDPLEVYPEFLQGGKMAPKDSKEYTDEVKSKKKNVKTTEAGGPYSLRDEMTGIGDGTTVPFETDEDVRNKTAHQIEHYWDRSIETPADKALYYGFHIHSKDNVYGLHAHYPGGPLGGAHTHGPQNKQGYHTHRYDIQELIQFKFSRPGVMIQLDGPHVHQHNAPDGKHAHSEESFGPASDERAQHISEHNDKVDKN